jgi:hypothetical protein
MTNMAAVYIGLIKTFVSCERCRPKTYLITVGLHWFNKNMMITEIIFEKQLNTRIMSIKVEVDMFDS